MDPRIGFLKSCELFSALPDERLEDVLEGVEEVKLESGSTLFDTGARGDAVYLVREGRTKVWWDFGSVKRS